MSLSLLNSVIADSSWNPPKKKKVRRARLKVKRVAKRKVKRPTKKN